MKKILKEYGMIILGGLIMAFGTGVFLLPNKLSTGGFTGIGTIFYYYMNIPMGISILFLNLPLFIIAYFKIRKKIFIKNYFCNYFLFSSNRFYGKNYAFY